MGVIVGKVKLHNAFWQQLPVVFPPYGVRQGLASTDLSRGSHTFATALIWAGPNANVRLPQEINN